MEKRDDKEKVPFVLSEKMGIFVVAVILALVFPTGWFSLYVINLLGLSEGSLINFLRFFCIFVLGIDAVPSAILAEFVGSRTLKRSFRWNEVSILVFAVVEFIVLIAVFLTISNTFFSQMEPIYQLPIAAINLAVVLVLWAYSTKIPIIHKQLEKMLH